MKTQKSLTVLMILAVLMNFVPMMPLPVQAVQAEAPPPPTLTVAPVPAATPEMGLQATPKPPVPEDLPEEAQKERARQAMEAVLNKYLDYLGPRYQAALNEVTLEGEWAHGVAAWQNETKMVDGSIHMLALRSEVGTWQALMPSEDGMYLQWVEEVPERLVTGGRKSELLRQATEVDMFKQPQSTDVVHSSDILTPTNKAVTTNPTRLIISPDFSMTTLISPMNYLQQSVYSLASPLFQWASDASLLLYRQLNSAPTGPGGSPYDLWLYDAEKNKNQLIESGGNLWRPSFANNGDIVQFWEDGDPYQAFIRDVNRLDLEPIDLLKVPIKGSFSPDGSQLMYVTAKGEVRFYQLESGEEFSLGTRSALAQPGFLWPEWSPDGDYIAFLSNNGYVYLLSSNALSLDDLRLLGKISVPQGELSPDLHYLRWTNDSASLLSYQGDVFEVQSSNFSGLNTPQTSSGNRFTAYMHNGEVFVYDTVTKDARQLTNNRATVLQDQKADKKTSYVTTAATADGFDFPVGKPDGNGYAPSGWEFLQWTGSVYHPGEDWNGVGGGDTDLGDPVYAIANGTVIDSNYYSSSWGNIILIEHILPDGSKVWSQYAHLQNRLASTGKEVSKGEQIGTIGKGAGDIYWAHLHFEIRTQYRSASAWVTGWSQNDILQYYVDPSNFINAHRQISGGCADYSYNGVVFFDSDNCGGSELQYSSPTGLVNLTDNGWNDRAKSIHVASSWSVKIYEHTDRNGASRCINGSMWDLSQDTYDNGQPIVASGNPTISSLEVFNNSTCSGSSPPPSGEVKLWDQANFDEGGSGNIVWQGGTGFSNGPNADSYSLEMPGGWSVKTWKQDNRGDEERCWSESVPNLQDHGWQMAIQSIEVFDHNVCSAPPPPSCDPNADQIALFVDANYGGTCVVKGLGTYSNPSAIGLPNDAISSLKVGANVQAILCKDDNYGGGCETFTGDDPNLGDNGIGDNQVSSVKVESRAPEPPTANFDAWPQGGDAPLTVAFHNISNGSYTTCYWEYGDGNTGNSCADYHDYTYQNPGVYTVHLTVTGPGGADTKTIDNYISVNSSQPDLYPFTPTGYDYPVVPSSEPGTSQVGELFVVLGSPTYFDWHFKNGGATAWGNFHVEVWIDDTRHIRYPYSDFGAGGASGFDDWMIGVTEPGWHIVRIVTDPDNIIAESDETNNVWERQFYWESTCDDVCELNNVYSDATDISYGDVKSAYICSAGDLDFYQFSGTAGDQVVIDIDASESGSALDSYIYLLDSDGATVLAQNDDEGSGRLDSCLGYTLSHDGAYYIEVRDYSYPNEGGPDYFYSIHLLTDANAPSSAEIASPATNDWMISETAVSVLAQDNESGVNRVEYLWHDADWEHSDWVWLGADSDGSDGWSFDFDASSESEQQGGAFYIWAFDWAGNWTGAASWNLGIDHTPPGSAYINTYAYYGDAPFRDFGVNWWNDGDNLSGVASYDIQARDGAGGAWTDFALGTTDTYTKFVGIDGHTYDFRARARDHAGNLGAYSDIASHTVDICNVAADVYESDNAAGNATRFTPDGYSQIHNTHTEEDADWVKFTAQAGITYTLTTGNTGGHADTVLELYATDGSTLLAANDDCPGRWPASCLDWQPASGGDYYVKVYHWDPWAYGCTTEYGLSITSNRPASLDLGDSGTAFRYVDTLGTTGEPYLTDAQHLNWPHSVAVDSAGNLYVTEVMGQRLLKFSPSGALLWAFGEAGSSFWDAQHLAYPHGVAVDETHGRVYVANSDTHSVQVFNTSGNYVATLGVLGEAGSDNTHFNNPKGVTVAADGTLYVSDTGNHRVQILDSAGNYLHTLGTGYGTGDYEFNGPEGLALDGNGHLYVADYYNHRVQVFTTARVYSATLGITGETGTDNTHFDHPNAVAVDAANNLYVVDNYNQRTQKFDENLNYLATLGESGVSGADNAHFDSPVGIAIGSDGALYVTDGNNHRIQKFSAGFTYLDTIGATGVPYLTDANHINKPGDVAVDSDGNRFVVEYTGHRLLKLGANGSVLATVGTAGVKGADNAHLSWPWGVTVAADGAVYIADTGNNRVQIFDNDLNYQATLGTGACGDGVDEFCGPHKVALDASGRLYVADTWNQRVQVFDSGHKLMATLGITGETGNDNLHFYNPYGVAVDGAGHIYVADEGNKRVQQCNLDGSCATFVGETGVTGDDFAHFRAPLGVAVDAQGRVYVADSWWNQRIQVFAAGGAYLITIGGEWGDRHGQLRNPSGITIAPDGALYIADTDSMRVEQFALGVPDWTPANINGFGDPQTTGVTALAEFGGQLYAGTSNWNSDHGQIWRSADGMAWEDVTPSTLTRNAVIDLTDFDGYLYAGTGWSGGAGQIWRSANGTTWSAVVADGFGDSDNQAITKLTAFNGYLYATTQNDAAGFGIWRSPTGAAGSWTAVLTGGHGSANVTVVTGLTVFDNRLYAACENETGGLELWRSANGTTWEQVASGGFDDPDNIQTGGFAVFDDHLYIGTRNNNTGAQLWRSANGSTWVPVMQNGFGDAANRKLESLYVVQDALHAVMYNDSTGAQVWSSADGATWESVRTDGWGDANNYATLWGNATQLFASHLYIGTWNIAHGGELWRLAVQSYVYLPLVLR